MSASGEAGILGRCINAGLEALLHPKQILLMNNAG